MASDGRAHYSPLAVRDGKGELEAIGMVLPPLTMETNSSNSRILPGWRRKAVISAIALFVIAVLIGAVVGIVTSTRNREIIEEFTVAPTYEETEKHIKPELNFQTDLRRAYENLMDEKRPEDLKKDFEYYRMELLDVKNSSELQDFLVVLGLKRMDYDLNEEDTRYAITITEDFYEWYIYLDELRKNLMQYDIQKKVKNLKVVPRVVMNRRKRKELDALLAEWTQPISVDANESRTIFKKKVILVSEVVELLKTNSKLLKNDIFIFSSSIVYLDEDISLPETNLALIAPSWIFVKNINIFIHGFDGVKHANEAAISGEPGLPGRPGGNGGFFFGVGNVTVAELHVHNDGGRGSDGQHGSDGHEGTVDEPKGFTPSKTFSCIKHVDDVRNVYGDVITYYEVFREYGCGGNGTDGGAAGPGGEGGRVILVNVRDGIVNTDHGKMGSSGNGGRGGAAGSGANWGCRFIAEETESGILQRVTKEVCGFFMPSGLPGRNGSNTAGMEEPVRRNSSFLSDALREFRAYAREEYANGRTDIWRLAEKLDDLGVFDNRTIVRDIKDEIGAIGEIGKIEFYESLNRRIGKALEASSKREVLTYLRTLSYGKTLALKNGIDNYVIIDLDIFLEKVSNDLKSADKRTFTFNDHTRPIFLHLLKGKMNFLSDTLDRWLLKTSKLIAEFDLKLDHQPADLPLQIDGRNMAYLTSMTAQVIKSLSAKILVYPGEEKKNVSELDIVVNDLLIHRESKSSSPKFVRRQSRMLTELKSLSRPGSKWKTNLKNLKHVMEVLNNLIEPQSEVSDFPVVLDYFESAAELLETVREKQTFSDYVAEINSFDVVSDEVKEMRDYLFEVLITAQYENALSVFRQWVFPHMNAYGSFLPKGKNLTLDDARAGIAFLQKSVREYKSTITSYDKYIREAVFSSNNSVGEYYKWCNSDIRSDLSELFRGREISLTADLESFHMLNKNAIKFRTVKLEFQTRLTKREKLSALLTNVQVEMRHSGYSYYYYNGQIYLKVGEGLDLRYSFESMPNGLPINFNMVYKKLMNAPPIYSPYTTWTIRLNPIPDELIKYAEDVDVALVGLGSYIEVVDNV